MDAAAVRAEVERVLAFYLAIDYFRTRAILPNPDRPRRSRTVRVPVTLHHGEGDREHVVLVPTDGICARKPSSPRAALETEREKTLWKSTVAAKLGRVPVAQRRLLLEAAVLSDTIRQLRRRVRSLGTLLGSPSKRAGMSRFDRARMTDAKAIGAGIAELLGRERSSIRRRNAYAEACEIFYRAAATDEETKAYIFESFLSEQ